MALVNLTYMLTLASRIFEQNALTREGRWADKQSLAHPFLTVVTSAGAGALAGALVRRTMAVRAGLTVGLLTALYLRRKYSHAAPVGAGSGAT